MMISSFSLSRFSMSTWPWVSASMAHRQHVLSRTSDALRDLDTSASLGKLELLGELGVAIGEALDLALEYLDLGPELSELTVR